MPRPPRRSNTVRYCLLAAGICIFLLMFVLPLIERKLPFDSMAGILLEWLRSRVMELMVALWFFAFGAMVGSFINVVVWRMPRGVSVVSRGSACPYCNSKIHLKDNIPIFGWIKLNGRCRVCRLPISPRYPIVEAIFGIVFLLLFYVQLCTANANFPGGSKYLSSGILQIVINTKWDVVANFAWHMTLIVMLLTWTFMAYDKSRIPVKTIAFALIVGGVGAVLLPFMQPVKWAVNANEWFVELPWLQRMMTGFLGLVCGFLIGGLIEAIPSGDVGSERTIGFSACLMTIGLFMGWQFAITVLLLFGLIMMMASSFQPAMALPPTSWLTLATVVHLCLWKQIALVTKGNESIPSWVVLAGVFAVGFGLVTIGIRSGQRSILSSPDNA